MRSIEVLRTSTSRILRAQNGKPAPSSRTRQGGKLGITGIQEARDHDRGRPERNWSPSRARAQTPPSTGACQGDSRLQPYESMGCRSRKMGAGSSGLDAQRDAQERFSRLWAGERRDRQSRMSAERCRYAVYEGVECAPLPVRSCEGGVDIDGESGTGQRRVPGCGGCQVG